MPKFSIILATRDRPGLFNEALASVLEQTWEDFEVIVVNDGSSSDHQHAYEVVYQAARDQIGERLKVHSLVRRPKGHGQSYSINYGVDHASSEYVCFLDDDDSWTDMGHLARAAAALAKAGDADLYTTNQLAYLHDVQVQGSVWLEALENQLLAKNRQPDSAGVFTLTVADLLLSTGFCHLNCLTARRTLFSSVGGMDEGIRWECDRDIFLRLIDRSRTILFHPAVVSKHNVPDPTKNLNMTTSVSMLEKRLLQVRVLDKASLLASSPLIRKHSQRHKAYALKKITEELVLAKNWSSAAYYAREALGAAPSFKWAAYTFYCAVRSI